MQLPKLTKKQQIIIWLIYRYRFLNRTQIQAFMGHKDYNRINVWLRYLRENHFLEWIYSTDFTEKSKPAIYYIGPNGIRWWRSRYEHMPRELRKRYYESSRTRVFIEECMLVADCCFALGSRNRDHGAPDNEIWSYLVTSDYADPDNDYHFLSEAESISPALFFSSRHPSTNGEVRVNRLLEFIEPTKPQYRIRNRLKKYIEFQSNGDWQLKTGEDNPPRILFVCALKVDMIYAKRVARRVREGTWNDRSVDMRFTTFDALKTRGIFASIWESL
jgi:hypothetical protein